MRYLRKKRTPLLAALTGNKPRCVSFHEVYPEAEVLWRRIYEPVSTPEARSWTFAERAKHFNREDHSPPPDFLAIARNALYSPGNEIVIGPNRNIIAESCNTAWVGNIFKRELYRRPVRHRGYAFLLRGPFKTYYHRLIEFLPRLLAISDFLKQERIPTSDVSLLIGKALNEHERFLLNSVGLSGIEIKQYPPGRPVSVDRLIFTPFKSHCFSGYIPPPYVESLRCLYDLEGGTKRAERILIVREENENRKIANDRDLQEELKRYDFTPYCLGTLPFTDQISLFGSAEAVVGAHGAGFANTIFSFSPVVLEAFPSHYIMPYYYLLSKSVRADYTFVAGSDNALRKSKEFYIDIDIVLKNLNKMNIVY